MSFHTDSNSVNRSGTVREQVFDGQNRAWEEAKALIDRAEQAAAGLNDIAARFETNPDVINALQIDEAKLNGYLDWLSSDGHHGLSPGIERQIFDRMRERTLAAVNDTVRQVTRRAAAAGWQQPPGALRESINQAEQNAAMEIAGQSRDIAIQQGQYEIDAFRLLLNSLLQLLSAKAGLDTEKVRMALVNANGALGYLLEAQKAHSQIAAQLGASALSVLNYNASTSSSTGASLSHSDNVSYDGGEGSPPFLSVSL
jgi:hypothetical protein